MMRNEPRWPVLVPMAAGGLIVGAVNNGPGMRDGWFAVLMAVALIAAGVGVLLVIFFGNYELVERRYPGERVERRYRGE